MTGPAPASVPEAVRRAALDVFDLRVVGARVLDLVYDSSVDDADGASVGARRLRFDGRPSGVDLQVVLVASGPAQVTTLRVRPARSVTVQVLSTQGTDSLATAADGLAVLHRRPRGLVCFVLRSGEPEDLVLQSVWVRL